MNPFLNKTWAYVFCSCSWLNMDLDILNTVDLTVSGQSGKMLPFSICLLDTKWLLNILLPVVTVCSVSVRQLALDTKSPCPG